MKNNDAQRETSRFPPKSTFYGTNREHFFRLNCSLSNATEVVYIMHGWRAN